MRRSVPVEDAPDVLILVGGATISHRHQRQSSCFVTGIYADFLNNINVL